ncbi:MAG: cytochrome c nitrite reductase small subunit [Phycisphaerales bacterium]
MQARTAISLLVAALGGLCGAGAYTFRYAEGLSYMSDDPKACVNCHIMREQYDGWQKSSHHASATCNDCHVPRGFVGKYTAKAVHGWRHSKAFTLQDFHEPIRISDEDLKIVQSNCLRCHGELTSQISAHAGPAGVEEANCTHCHRGVGHGPQR